MLVPISHGRFEKALKKAEKRGKNMEKFKHIVRLLLNSDKVPLPAQYCNHKLKGNMIGNWECHIEPDWLLVYQKTSKHIIFVDMGSHSDLF